MLGLRIVVVRKGDVPLLRRIEEADVAARIDAERRERLAFVGDRAEKSLRPPRSSLLVK
jgi:hypothetical protein